MLRALRVATARRTDRAINYLRSPRVVNKIGLETVGSKPALFAPAEVEVLVSCSTTAKSDPRRYTSDVIDRLP